MTGEWSPLVLGLVSCDTPVRDSRGVEPLTDGMDTGEYITPMDNMDTTLAELGDEFTLGDFDGESVCLIRRCLLLFV